MAYQTILFLTQVTAGLFCSIISIWWTPEALYQTYLGTDAEFQRVSLPPPTQDCVEARINPDDRCSADLELQVGDPLGSCDDPPHPLFRLTAESLYEMSYDPLLPESMHSPGHDAIGALTLSGLQIGKIFDYWLKLDSDKWGYDPREATCQWFVDNLDMIKSVIPRSYPRVLREDDDLKDPLFFTSLSLGIAATLLVSIAMILTWKHRTKRALMQAQVEFLWILLIGLLMVAVGAVLLVIPPSDVSCSAIIWLTNLGYTMELVPLIIKVAAINRLMLAAQRMRRVVLKRQSLFGAVFLLSGLVVCYLVLWTILDPPIKKAEYDLTDRETDTGETIVLRSYYCQSNSNFWFHISVAYHVMLLICATVLAFQMRKVQHDINESQVLAILIYSHFVFVMLRVLAFSLEDSLHISYLARYQSIIYSGDAIATCFIYFFPKFVSIKDSENSDEMLSGASFHVSRSSFAHPGGLRGSSQHRSTSGALLNISGHSSYYADRPKPRTILEAMRDATQDEILSSSSSSDANEQSSNSDYSSVDSFGEDDGGNDEIDIAEVAESESNSQVDAAIKGEINIAEVAERESNSQDDAGIKRDPLAAPEDMDEPQSLTEADVVQQIEDEGMDEPHP